MTNTAEKKKKECFQEVSLLENMSHQKEAN